MKARILYIGMLCKDMAPQYVDFVPGVNVVTGRSSTGKSALIEVFDYCFGSSEYTVPVGIITRNTLLFFTVFEMDGTVLVLGRQPKTAAAYIIEDYDVERFESIDWLSEAYFTKSDRYSLQDYLVKLKGFFGVDVVDVDEDLEAKTWRGKKLGAPSARSFTSFMLQHQNLVANKHALFYRFDQKEKREQVIEHLKIFLGFVDQAYFLLKQKLSELEVRRRQLLREIPRKADQKDTLRTRLGDAKFELEAVSGKLVQLDIEAAISSPRQTLEQFRAQALGFKGDSEVPVQKLQEEQERRMTIIGRLRALQVELADVQSAIAFSERYASGFAQAMLPVQAELKKSDCPLCHSASISVEPEANQLTDAINWLNSELRRSSYRAASRRSEQVKLKADLAKVRAELTSANQRVARVRQQVADPEKADSQIQHAMRARVRLESLLEECVQLHGQAKEDELVKINEEIGNTVRILKKSYNVDIKMTAAERRIEELMGELCSRFDFEATYGEINLKFSLEDFELWHQEQSGEKVFLRSMGSGANWLSCHVVLFLSLHAYFCEQKEKCLIPPVLFLDQPSQVYFPSILDGEKEFNAQELAKKDTSRGNRKVDADLKAVTDLFDNLVLYCSEVEAKTGICPQIIVTDHADNLKLSRDVTFESLVRRRWRGELDGFIDLNKKLGVVSED